MNYPTLFSPGVINQLNIKNRVVMTAMGVDAWNPNGTISEDALSYYRERAQGGVGLIISEYTRVNEHDGVVATAQPSLSSDRYIREWKKVADTVHSYGTKLFVQLHHPGRAVFPMFGTVWSPLEKIEKVYPNIWDVFFKVSSGQTEGIDIDNMSFDELRNMQKLYKPTLCPSMMSKDIPDADLLYIKHRAFKAKEIKKLIRQFINAAERAQKAGVDGVELHAGHGYLLQQFLSDFTNRRTDKYGGSLKNRCRIIVEIIRGIHERCGKDFPVIVRMTADELEQFNKHPERGYHEDEAARIARILEKAGADGLDVTVSNIDTSFLTIESSRHLFGWRSYAIRSVKEAVSIPVIATNMIRTPEQGEELLASGIQDFIGLGRPLLVDPQWAKKAQEGKESLISRCIGCLRCSESFRENMFNEKPIECSINPRVCHESHLAPLPAKDSTGKKAVIVGAGVAGLIAARELLYRGFDVTVFEKGEREGGQLHLAKVPPFKDKIIWAAEDLLAQVTELGGKIHYNTEAHADMILAEKADCVIIASGASAIHPRIPGAEQDHVYTVTPVLEKTVTFKNQDIVIVGSGMTGLETAEMLSRQDNRVTVVEMAEHIAPGVQGLITRELLEELKEHHTVFLPQHKLEQITETGVILTDTRGNRKTLHADNVILSLGVRSDNALFEELNHKQSNLFLVGDAEKPGRIVNAVHNAFRLARSLSF